MKITPRMIFTAILVVLLVAFNVVAFNFNYQARMMPLIIGVPVMILAIVQLVIEVRGARAKSEKAVAEVKKEQAEEEPEAPRSARRVLSSSAWLIGMMGSIYVLGFIATTFLYPLLYMKFVGKRSWRLAFIISLGAIVFIWAVMIQALNVDLYDGLVPGVLRKSLFVGY